MKDSQLNVYNLKQMRQLQPESFDFVRFDPNNDCNVHCVYCHNHRSKDAIDTEELRAFLDENVLTIENFQMGCVMEPTLDKRLTDLMLLISRSKGRPKRRFILQTNGILLHMHDHARMLEAGLNEVSVSIDAADAPTHKALRGGTSIAKVGSNIAAFRKDCPDVRVTFITTVTRINLAAMKPLVQFGLDLGVTHFVMREVFYQPDSNVVDHARMPELLLKEGEFDKMADEIRSTFGRRAEFDLADNATLERVNTRMKNDSFR
jgi:MoaA/NifB/PqqE/SkfB family radical SAM enzyme